MTNHVNGKSPQGLENHDSIVSSYKELIREQVNILALFLSSKQPRDSVDSPRKSVTLTSSGDFQFRPELKCRRVFFLSFFFVVSLAIFTFRLRHLKSNVSTINIRPSIAENYVSKFSLLPHEIKNKCNLSS